MIIISPSVPHCGRHFMEERIFYPEFKIINPYEVKHQRLDCVVTGHFEQHNGFTRMWSNVAKICPAYVVLRHPARVLAAFEGRKTVGSNYAEFTRQWRAMMDFTKAARSVKYLHLDSTLREDEAAQIMGDLGISKRVDWSVVGSKTRTHRLSITDELCERVPTEFINFYYETMEV